MRRKLTSAGARVRRRQENGSLEQKLPTVRVQTESTMMNRRWTRQTLENKRQFMLPEFFVHGSPTNTYLKSRNPVK